MVECSILAFVTDAHVRRLRTDVSNGVYQEVL